MARIDVASHPTDAKRGGDAEGDQAKNRSDVDEDGTRRARKADLRQHVRCETLTAQHHEIPGRPGEQGDQRARDKRVLHEVELEQQLHVCDQIPRRPLH